MNTRINPNEVSKRFDLPNGRSIVLFDRLAKESIYGREECARNIFLVDQDGQIVWQVKSDFDLDGDPFTNIFYDDKGEIFGYRWDGCKYKIDLETGQAIPTLLMR